MGKVRLLEGALIDQIAAGEVVERPASVVKELLDNAIDAGAQTIRVELQEGGRERILVQDDGAGMDPEDAALSVQRHATSKVRRLEDLLAIRTLGFRGEALASIASVSRFRMLTRPADRIEGTEVRIEGGNEPQIRATGCSAGTTIDVQELFFNVPARRKFLRARQTELNHVAKVCLNAALANPSLRLSLHHNGRLQREFVPARSRLERARKVDAEVPLFEARGHKGNVRVEAVLSPPKHAKKGARNLRLFVNDRPIIDRQLAFAISFAFGDALRPRHYPVGVVFIEMPPEDVDVNAHPQKTEVRFRSPREVSAAVTAVVQGTLRGRRGPVRAWAAIDGPPPMLDELDEEEGPDTERATGDERATYDVGPSRADSVPVMADRRGFWSARLGSGPRVEGMAQYAPSQREEPFTERAERAERAEEEPQSSDAPKAALRTPFREDAPSTDRGPSPTPTPDVAEAPDEAILDFRAALRTPTETTTGTTAEPTTTTATSRTALRKPTSATVPRTSEDAPEKPATPKGAASSPRAPNATHRADATESTRQRMAAPSESLSTAPSEDVHVVGRLSSGAWLVEHRRWLRLFHIPSAQVDRAIARASLGQGASATLLFPARLDLDDSDLQQLAKEEAVLTAWGFDCNRLGGGTLAVHAIPNAFSGIDPALLLRAALKGEEALLAEAPAQSEETHATFLRAHPDRLAELANQRFDLP